MSIELDDIASGYNLSKINTNFQKIENEFNNNVLRRNGLDANEDNTMQNNLDMNSHAILNAITDPNDDGSLVSMAEFKRAVRAPHGETLVDLDLAADRSSKLLGFDSAGQPVTVNAGAIPSALALMLASHSAGEGASMVGLSPYGNVQQAIYWVTPEMFGAAGDGVTDDKAAWQSAVNTGLEVRGKPTATYLLSSSVVFTWPAVKQLIDGRGCTIKVTGNYTPFAQTLSDATTTRTTQNKSYINIAGIGPTSAAGVYATYSSCDLLDFAYGYAANITGTGFTNVIRGRGFTSCFNIRGYDLRNALWSCYSPGFNTISDSSCDWCSGDGLVMKGEHNSASNITFGVAGAIPANTQEANINSVVRGVVISAGADGDPANYCSLSNITCQYFGYGGAFLNGSSINVGGVMNLGSIYEDTYLAAQAGPALALITKNSQIGDVKFGTVFSGISINANSNNTLIGEIDIVAKKAVSGAYLLSVSDSSSTTISNVRIRGIIFHGQSTINDDVYINTAGINIDYLHITALNNQQGGNSVNIAKAATIGELNLVATTSAATNNIVLLSAAARLRRIYVERVFGTAITVASGAIPIIGDIVLANKQGTVAPIRINGDGTGVFVWGNVTISGPTSAAPLIDGAITMQGYYGPTWKRLTSSVASTATYPVKTANALVA